MIIAQISLCCDASPEGPEGQVCDEASPPETNVTAARATARQEGWISRRGLDLCPVHAHLRKEHLD